MIQRYIPGWNRFQQLFLLLTGIGVAIHELGHKTMATEFNVAVHEVCYFQFGDPAGYVRHDIPRTYTAMFAVSVAPFIFNTAIAYAAFVLAGGYLYSASTGSLSYWELVAITSAIWLGIASCLHAFPSSQDISNIWSAAKALWRETPFGILGAPIFLFRHPYVILSIPFIASLILLDRLKVIGSSWLYTALILLISYHSIGLIFTDTGFQWPL